MADNTGTSPSHKANRFVELLSEAENLVRNIEPAVEVLIPPRYKPYVALAGAVITAFEAPEGPTVTDSAFASGDTPQAVIETHAELQNELLAREPLPDPVDAEVESVNVGGALVGETPPPAPMSPPTPPTSTRKSKGS